MRKFILNFFPLFLLLCFSCTPENTEPVGPEPQEPAQESIEILQTLMPFSATADDVQTLLFSSATDWKISSEQGWCHFAQTKGEAGEISLAVTVDAHKGAAERDARVLLSSASGKVREYIRLVQKPEKSYLLSSSRAEVPAAGGALVIHVDKAVTATVEIPEEITWLTVKSSDDEQVTLSARANDTDAPRVAEVHFKHAAGTETLTVYQEGKTATTLLLSKGANLSCAAGRLQVDIKTGPAFQVEVPSGCDWCHYQPADQTSAFSAVFTVDENSTDEVRKTKLIFRQEATGATEEFELVQFYKGVVALTTTKYELTAAAQQLSLTLRANVDFRIEADQPWIRPVESKAMTTHELLFDIDENTVTEVREGQITITYTTDSQEGKSEVALVQIVQAAAKPLQYLVIEHNRQEMVVPEIMGTGFKAEVLWEQGMEWVGYSTGLTHKYQTASPYRLEIKGTDMEEVFLPVLTDIKTIDFSRF